jgi:hypothetical protein
LFLVDLKEKTERELLPVLLIPPKYLGGSIINDLPVIAPHFSESVKFDHTSGRIKSNSSEFPNEGNCKGVLDCLDESNCKGVLDCMDEGNCKGVLDCLDEGNCKSVLDCMDEGNCKGVCCTADNNLDDLLKMERLVIVYLCIHINKFIFFYIYRIYIGLLIYY